MCSVVFIKLSSLPCIWFCLNESWNFCCACLKVSFDVLLSPKIISNSTLIPTDRLWLVSPHNTYIKLLKQFYQSSKLGIKSTLNALMYHLIRYYLHIFDIAIIRIQRTRFFIQRWIKYFDKLFFYILHDFSIRTISLKIIRNSHSIDALLCKWRLWNVTSYYAYLQIW